MKAILDKDNKIIRYEKSTSTVGVDVSRLKSTSGLKTLLDINKQLKLLDIRQNYQAKIDAITAKYAPYEVESFADQRAEWRAWHIDSTTPTPIVDALATARGIDREVLLSKIGDNVLAITTIQGEQNALEDRINACTTLEELEAIVV